MSDGGAHYITREGANRLLEELSELRTRRRPKIVQEVADAAAQGDRSENAEYIYGKRKLREIDRRIQWLMKRLDSLTIVEPRADGVDKVFFGATVEVEDDDGARACYRIVGEDEVDLDRGDISWRSPLGRALLNKRAGDTASFRRPAARPDLARYAPREGARLEPVVELTVVSVRYGARSPR